MRDCFAPLRLKGEVYEEIFHKPSAHQLGLLKPPEERKREELIQVMDVLGTTDLCRTLDEETLYELAKEVEFRTVTTGDVIIQQGEPVDCCCILLSGRVVTKAESTSELVVQVRRSESQSDEGQR